MSGAKENAAVVGAGVTACAVCCAGPMLGLLAALGIGAAAGALLFGVAGLVVVAILAALLAARRRRRQPACTTPPVEQPLAIGPARGRDV